MESSISSTSTVQAVYDPTGHLLLKMSNGTTSLETRVPLPGGALAIYNAGGLANYSHPDWRGTSRMLSTPTAPTPPSADAAFAPFGEQYLPSGSFEATFTGAANHDTSQDMFDFAFREYYPLQGRWISPDPSGLKAVDPTNPQSWNRYAMS